jgi:peptidoglycan-N-acetylglucosamine deacetylase
VACHCFHSVFTPMNVTPPAHPEPEHRGRPTNPSSGQGLSRNVDRDETARDGPFRDHPDVIRHALAPHVPSAAGALGIARSLPPGATGVAITFDDGPHPEGTPAILELLARAGAQATFFVVGEQVERRPALAREIVAGGHGIALHGYRHALQLRMSATAVKSDLDRGAAAIADATGANPGHHRPPYGVYSPAGLQAARKLGLQPLLWSRWGKDWRKFTTPQRIAARITPKLELGDVILLHDADFYSSKYSHRRTADALKIVLIELKARGLGTVLPV